MERNENTFGASPQTNENEPDETAEERVEDLGDDVDALKQAIENERQRSAEYLDQAQRATAELVNYRRRTDQERDQLRKQASERVLGRVLPAIDDLHRAVQSIPEEEREAAWSQGVLLIEKKLWQILESEGVTPIEALGKPFDPSVHEAVSVIGDGDGADTVVQEFQRGYMLHDRVLRPAMVVVGRPDEVQSDE